VSAFRAAGIGWSLHRQDGGYLESAYYHEIEEPLDSCWMLDAMIADSEGTVAAVHLLRPRDDRRFTVDDVQRLDRLRPWLAYAFRRRPSDEADEENQAQIARAGPIALSGQLILTLDGRLAHQTSGAEYLLGILAGEPGKYTRYLPARDQVPAPVRSLLGQITGTVTGTSNSPPCRKISTPHGVVTVDAKWLLPAHTVPEDAVKDPRGSLVLVTIELHEHPISHAARVLRESGATPGQVKVGIHLALGKTKPLIADELGLQPSSVADITKKLYQTLDVHNSAELGLRIWLGPSHDAARQISRGLE
jgi:hypothetical protein